MEKTDNDRFFLRVASDNVNSGRIPQDFIDDLVARADIVEVVGNRVPLKKAGREFKACCPFHDEKTPSFTVVPQKGFYHCFGCGEHGTAIGFLMNYDRLGFVEAVEALAEMLGVEVPRTRDDTSRSRDDSIYDVLKEADQIYRNALRENPDAIAYLKKRGIDGTTAGRFAMGYAPDAWDTVLRQLGTSDARIKLLRDAGLVIRNEQGREYDRFRNRIMFPIRDPRGRVIGFGGRVLGHEEPKYLNSPETPVFHKGRSLYGLYEARQVPGRPAEILVVEGYLDVASLSQHGIEPSVATLGTATTADHMRRLTRITDRIVFCFDGDRAGRKAAWRALETVLPHAGGTVELKFLLLPEAQDPDDFVRRHGADAFRDLLRTAKPLSEFLIDELEAQVDLSTTDGRSRLTALVGPMLEKLPPGVYRELLMERLAELVGIAPERLESLITVPKAERPRTAPIERPAARNPLVRKAITLVLHHPGAAAEIEVRSDLDYVNLPGIDLLRRLLEVCRSNPQITTAGLEERFREDPEGRYLSRLAGEPPIDNEQVAPAVLRDNITRLAEIGLKERQDALIRKGSALSETQRAELAEINLRLSRRDAS
ncbi:MAG TPA: DNA primase [Gammaproteobacteria bacterium]